MEKLTVNQIYINDTNAQNQPYMTKTGKAYQLVTIYTAEHGEGVRLTGTAWDGRSPLLNIKQGDIIDAIVERNGEYLNFKLPDRLDKLVARVENLEKLAGVNQEVPATPVQDTQVVTPPAAYPNEPRPEDIPF